MDLLIECCSILGIILLNSVADCSTRSTSHLQYYSYRYSDTRSDSWIAGAVIGGIFGFIVLLTITYICCHANGCCKITKPNHRRRAVEPGNASHPYTTTINVQSRPGSEISRNQINIHTEDLVINNQSEFFRNHAPVDSSSNRRHFPINEPPPSIPGYRPQMPVVRELSEGRILSPPPPYTELDSTIVS
ncbi:uncharacterized protein LOC125656220 [Ostrea edulis]|uniref:uncharacterized protein LOC125656220 n=1 Tax=Ostrea edulis TaxID=37623 RepID=UPI002094E44E|nr:uncharacterized protein LOC125656220 [Ostrea edulis]